ncbi:hypothetical protein HPB50_015758 [Hyalomma asiaticum]|uniref:Uncharacterized protein n=1 Tax=Hyalomma asiaticum TaxID=266040 RepID=A0ACB7SYX0_HYAAI|nr:hypothetical protein HPB50_015758 [Hyalomma asiaticum]
MSTARATVIEGCGTSSVNAEPERTREEGIWAIWRLSSGRVGPLAFAHRRRTRSRRRRWRLATETAPGEPPESRSGTRTRSGEEGETVETKREEGGAFLPTSADAARNLGLHLRQSLLEFWSLPQHDRWQYSLLPFVDRPDTARTSRHEGVAAATATCVSPRDLLLAAAASFRRDHGCVRVARTNVLGSTGQRSARVITDDAPWIAVAPCGDP